MIPVIVERTIDFVKTFCPLVISPDCLTMSLRSLYYVFMMSAERDVKVSMVERLFIVALTATFSSEDKNRLYLP